MVTRYSNAIIMVGDGQTLASWPMYQLKHKGTPAFEIFEVGLAKMPEDDHAALGVVPVPKVMGRPWHHGLCIM